MKWEKQGLIFKPNNTLFWQNSHAALPTKLHLGGSDYRIYFTSRDSSNRTYVGFFELDLKHPTKIRRVSKSPILSPGEWGCFDDHGVQACSISKSDNGDLFLYYLGWNPGLKQPLFYTSIGLAISRNGGESFEKYSEAPILQRSKYDPWMVSGGTVIRNNKEWLMYYLSGFKFEFNQGKPNSFYDIKIARSNDGINWNRNGDVALGLKTDESNISRMSIIKTANKYKAWFPVKKIELKYRCGFASSIDGINWDRKYDDVLQVSDFGWDSAAIDKMEVIEYNGNFYMFYNGNSFGIDGIGLAVANE